MKHTLFTVFLILLLNSCQKEKNSAGDLDAGIAASVSGDCPVEPYPPNDDREFVPGRVIIGLKDTVGIATVFAICNQCDLLAEKIREFSFTIEASADSIPAIRDYLISKPYLTGDGLVPSVKLDSLSQLITVRAAFFNMDITRQQDWLQTMKELGIKDAAGNLRGIMLKVPAGQEQYWIQHFSTDARVRYAEYDGIIHLFGE